MASTNESEMSKYQLQSFSSNQLRGYRGENNNGLIYLSIKGLVYDVSRSRHLYGPDGPYHVFAGREIARALALFSLSEKECTDDISHLDEDQLNSLEEWVDKFNRQYQIVGKINDPLWQRVLKSFF